MFAPNTTSPGPAPRKRAAVSWAEATSSSLAREVANAPPRFAFAVAQVRRDRVDDRVGHLRPARPVEERERRAQRGEARPHGLDVVAVATRAP